MQVTKQDFTLFMPFAVKNGGRGPSPNEKCEQITPSVTLGIPTKIIGKRNRLELVL